MRDGRLTRRQAIKAGLGALALPAIIPASALGQGDRPGANERLNVGIIGLGGRARWLAQHSLRNVAEVDVVAVCDIFRPRVDGFANDLQGDATWSKYDNFLEMIEQENLDGVLIETTTHARAWVTVLAMQAGMDVYIEKPMCLTIAEGREMVEAARRYGRVTQVGTQQRTIPINVWASNLVRSGALGRVDHVVAPNFTGPLTWEDQPEQPLPDGASDTFWDVWTNQAIMRPYHPQLHYGWAQWWDYDGGGKSFGVTGWGTHAYDQLQCALGTDDTGPVEVVLEEPVEVKSIWTDSDDMTLAGPRAKVTMRYANGTELRLHRDRVGNTLHGLGANFVCEEGEIEIERNQVTSDPPEIVQSPDNPGPNDRDECYYHVLDWAQCIKSRGTCAADIEYGQRAHTLCYLVNIARDVGRVGEVLEWDPVAERFTNCDEGNAMLSRPRREGYELPS
jgi:predicted dehydrogenase